MKISLCKRLLSLAAILALVLTSLAVGTLSVSAEAEGDYTYSVTDGTAAITRYTGSGGDITIPSKLGGYPVTAIGTYAFINCTGLTSVIIPDSVTSIRGYAFANCTGLTAITLPDSVTDIWSWAFKDCTELTTVTIPDSVTSIGWSAFSGCSKLTTVTISDSVTSMGYDAFGNTAWYNAQPDGLVYAGKVAYAYKGTMPDNTTITLKPDTKGIAGGAFLDCTGLTAITLPDSVTIIESRTFEGCTGLTTVTIVDGVTEIGHEAFYGCTGLKAVTVPASVTTIGLYALGYVDESTLVEGFILYGTPGTAAETYATENGITFVPVSTTTTDGSYEKGDINRDNTVDMRDARLLFQYVSGTATLDEQQLALGDVTGRGATDMLDARKLFQMAAGN